MNFNISKLVYYSGRMCLKAREGRERAYVKEGWGREVRCLVTQPRPQGFFPCPQVREKTLGTRLLVTR